MTSKKILPAVLALASFVAAAGTSARAAVATASGDLFLAFRTSQGSSSFNLVVDLGPASNIALLGPGTYNFNLGGSLGANIGLAVQDLRNVFGDGATNASWNGISDLVWSVAGATGGSSNNTLWVTADADTLTRRAGSVQSIVRGTIEGVRVQANGQASLISPQSAKLSSTVGNSYSIAVRNGDPGTYTNDYNYSQWGVSSTERAVASGGATPLKFFQLQSGGTAAQQALGTFTLGNDGAFTYTVVPEPGTASLVGIAAVGLLGLRRKRPIVSP